jgi:hypothetical protein
MTIMKKYILTPFSSHPHPPTWMPWIYEGSWKLGRALDNRIRPIFDWVSRQQTLRWRLACRMTLGCSWDQLLWRGGSRCRTRQREQLGSPVGHYSLFFLLLFICAYKAWVISPPCPHPLPYHPLCPLPLSPTPSIPSRNYFALISNFVVERV